MMVRYMSFQLQPKYYRRYVDDTFLMFEKRDHLKKFLKYKFSRHQSIKFTFEEEYNIKITFMDKPTTTAGDELQKSLFREKKFSGVYLSFNSHLPSEYKKGLLCTLLYRGCNICSNYNIPYLKFAWQITLSHNCVLINSLINL